MAITSKDFALEEIGKLTDEQLREFVRSHGGIQEAAIAIGERFAADGEMHIDTSTIVNWIVSRVGADVRTAC